MDILPAQGIFLCLFQFRFMETLPFLFYFFLGDIRSLKVFNQAQRNFFSKKFVVTENNTKFALAYGER